VARRIAITGAAGQLGRSLVNAFRDAGDEVLSLARPDFDITRANDLARLTTWHPDIVINSAAWTDVDGCALDPRRAMEINGEAAGAVAEAAERAGALVVQISTNEVFDGALDRPYVETDMPQPINSYGASKLAGELATSAANPRNIIVRTSWLFGPSGSNFVTKILAASERASAVGAPVRVVEDEWGNPTWTPWLAAAIEELLARASPGRIQHAVGMPAVSRLGWARVAFAAAHRDVAIVPIPMAEFERASTPPPRALLGSLTPLTTEGGGWEEPTRRLAVGGAQSAPAVDAD
jgi:dTDP-4-dehydrorhamnose reductase